jgi:hypothetical protein
LVDLVQEEDGQVIAKKVEARANLSDLFFGAWALDMDLRWGLGAVA